MDRVALVIVGVLFIALTFNDVFQSVIVPRSVGRRLRASYYNARALWWTWPRLARFIRGRDPYKRENFLAAFAPFYLILNLVLWSLMLLIGYGAIFYALRSQMRPELRTFGEALYFAGSSFLTIGFGDFVGSTGITRMFSLLAGASGFGLVSITTAYLFAVFGSFQTREQFVVSVAARAGSPPSGVALLAIAARAGVVRDLPSLMRSAESWCASLMETHLAYPVLAYFRSSHDSQSWVGTLGTLLDASVLLMTTVESDVGEAAILYNIGQHAARDLATYFSAHGFEFAPGPGITREQFTQACTDLSAAGLRLREDNTAWERFVSMRSTYAGYLNALAGFFQIPPLQWISEKELPKF
ncbi:MAG TPA: potassium channel family protein [Candidatus Acidoferrum sp.]|nr:potassium channel family protein [Candidatus Acidoferrum sp.]